MTNCLAHNDLSNRVCTAVGRPDINQTEVEKFQTLLKEAFTDTDDRIILNADESHWKVLMPPRRCITHKGSDSVKISINGDKRAGFTILSTISSDGDKFPLVLFAEGSTEKYHKQLGVHPKYIYKVVHSTSGWMNEAIFIEYLSWIRTLVNQKKIYLIADQFGPHFGKDAEAHATSLHIKLIPVPKGGTGIYQPLDRGIFGIMKKKGAAEWAKMCSRNPQKKWDKQTATEIALES